VDRPLTRFFVSVVRFSAALTLYSVAQMERSLDLFGGDVDVSKTMREAEKTLTSLSNVLIRQTSKDKKGALDSFSNASRTVADRTVENMQVMDPREMLKASNELLEKFSDAAASWVSKSGDTGSQSSKPSKEHKRN
jgi:hypothetical protein